VKRISSVLGGARARLVEHFELFLTAASVFLAIALIFVGLPRGEQGLAHAFLLWLQGFLI
jgi:hypothetical protein